MKATAKALLWILISAVLLCSSCSPKETLTAHEAITALCGASSALPSGRLYLRDYDVASSSHQLTDPLLSDLFGAGKLPPEMDLVQDAALYLAYAEPFEYAVFCCKSRDDTSRVALLCQQRIDRLRHPYATVADMPLSLQNAVVSVRGRWVVLCMSPDPDTAIRAFRRLF